jgi:hypothetical protein
MFQRSSTGTASRPFHSLAVRLGIVAPDRTKAVAPVPDVDMPAETGFGGFETFGRGGLDIGGLHRDQQWVGAWGGRC